MRRQIGNELRRRLNQLMDKQPRLSSRRLRKRIFQVVQSKVSDIRDSKWAKVKEYYERSYKIRFKKKLTDEKIEELYKKMTQLTDEMRVHLFQKPGLVPKIGNPPPIRTSGKDG